MFCVPSRERSIPTGLLAIADGQSRGGVVQSLNKSRRRSTHTHARVSDTPPPTAERACVAPVTSRPPTTDRPHVPVYLMSPPRASPPSQPPSSFGDRGPAP